MTKLITAVVTLVTLSLVVPVHGGAQQETKVVHRAKKKNAFFSGCHKNSRFNESKFGHNARIAGRCLGSKKELKHAYKSIGTYPGHHPSQGRAMDVMVNQTSSCQAGKSNGYKIAYHFMNNAKKYKVYYIVWRGRIWNANYENPKPLRKWRRGGGSGGCTHAHYDHVHLAFR